MMGEHGERKKYRDTPTWEHCPFELSFKDETLREGEVMLWH
jgi:hypothetical protein